MIFQKHCPGCFTEKSGLAICPHCGYDESLPRSPLFLPHGMVLVGQYRVGRVLGKPGGFGITYLAWDVHLQQRVAIKEYLPRDLAERAAESADVQPVAGESEAAFKLGLEHFLHEARLIARFDHPNIMGVRNFFRAHGSAYLVMDYYEGKSLGDYLHEVGAGSIEAEAGVRLLAPVLEGLHFVHERGIVHRDIKPHNIYLTADGRTILLDFGAAQAPSNAAVSGAVVLSEGYAPPEQYQKNGEQGPWTDIYAVAATLYRMLKGRAPPPALERIEADPLTEPMGLGAPAFEAILRKALALRRADRYDSAELFRQGLFSSLDLRAVTAPSSHRYSPAPAAGTRGGDDPEQATTRRPLAAEPTTEPAPRRLPPGLLGPVVMASAILLGSLLIAAVLWLKL